MRKISSDRLFVRPVFYGFLLFSLFLYSCASTRRLASPAPNYAADVAGVYYGSGKLWSRGDVKDVVITLTRDNDTTATASIEATLPAALKQLGGRQTLTGALTVSPNYELTGSVKLFIFKFTVKDSSVDLATHTIQLNFSGNIMGHPLNFELTGGSEPPEPDVSIRDSEIITAFSDGEIKGRRMNLLMN